MKNGTGRFIGGFYGLAPFTKYSEMIPLLGKAFAGKTVDPAPQLDVFMSKYGIDDKFIRGKIKQDPGMSLQPGQGS
ncbi:hypothetical protein RYA05_05050 [Pseudomonas syringae pv. actinidiae]|nr:hypothetical protein [Pseudomonas syringae pv. actinidiae]